MSSPPIALNQTLISVGEALDLSTRDYLQIYSENINRVLVSSLTPFHLVRNYVRAQGIHLWDSDGNKYYDFFNGFGCLNLGHNHPSIVSALQQALERRVPMIHQLSPSTLQAALAHNLAALLPRPLQVASFQCSGTESIEAALKLARKSTGRKHFLSMRRAYHGRTMGALSLTGLDHYRNPFEPLLPCVDHIPYGNADALEKQISTRPYAAVFIEPIQGQGGINVPPADYLKRARLACDRTGTLLVLDEIQTGMGRTGKMFAFEHSGVTPDIVTISKSLGGGIMPISACVTTEKIWKKAYGTIKNFLLHGSTFGGNALACVSGLAALDTLVGERLCENCAKQGEYLQTELARLKSKHDMIKEVKGRGLMIGLTFELPEKSKLSRISQRVAQSISPKLLTTFIASRFLNEFGIIVPPSLTEEQLIRVFPPLNVERADLDYFLSALDAVCASLPDYTGLLRQTGKLFRQQYIRNLRKKGS